MKKFLKDESGVTAIEYGLIAAAMAAALVAVMPTLSSVLKTQFGSISSHIKNGS